MKQTQIMSSSTVLSFPLSLLQRDKSVRRETAIVPSPLGRSWEEEEEDHQALEEAE
jgi:hypothetical protein|tara:strand:- start:375 stop:542 length:168 start_codon:yes stop_codon:yes gene_type:complete